MRPLDVPSPSLVTLATLLIGTLALGGCQRQSESDSEQTDSEQQTQQRAFLAGAQADDVTAALDRIPKALDPSRVDNTAERHLAYNLFEGLVMPARTTEGAETSDDRIRAGLADDWETSDDATTYTFHLRKGAQWSDGDSVTAGDVLYGWKRALDPDRDVPNDRLLDCIRGAEAFRRGETDDWNDVGVETPDPRTLVVRLRSPTPDFLERMAHPVAFPHPTHVVEQHGDQWTTPDHFETNGAYELAEYAPDRSEVVLEANSAYWDAPAVSIDRVVFRAIPDDERAVDAYRDERLHWIAYPLSVAAASSVRDHRDYTRHELLSTTYLQFDAGAEESATADPTIRRALSAAISREKLAENVFDGFVEPARGFVPAALNGYQSVTDLTYDVERARELLEEAGETGESMNLVLLYPRSPDAVRLADAIREIWANNLGVEVTLEEARPARFRERVANREYDVAMREMLAPTSDPATILAPWHFESARWSHPEYDEMMAEITGLSPSKKRTNLVQRAEELLLDRAPVLPVYHAEMHGLVAESLQGFEPHDRNVHLLKDLSLDETAPLDEGTAASGQGR
jgi:oligopeptide transport system substrate-binding protein